MRQTVNQYISSVTRLNPEIKHQTNCWPYPQTRQSHIDFWIGDYKGNNHTTVYLVNTDCKGALIRIKDGEPNPSELVKQFLN